MAMSPRKTALVTAAGVRIGREAALALADDVLISAWSPSIRRCRPGRYERAFVAWPRAEELPHERIIPFAELTAALREEVRGG
jgi:hypothetical protein